MLDIKLKKPATNNKPIGNPIIIEITIEMIIDTLF